MNAAPALMIEWLPEVSRKRRFGPPDRTSDSHEPPLLLWTRRKMRVPSGARSQAELRDQPCSMDGVPENSPVRIAHFRRKRIEE